MKLSDRLRLEADDALAQGARNLALRLSEMADEAVSLEERCASGSSATRGAGRNGVRRNGRRGEMGSSETRFCVGRTWLTRAEYDALPMDASGWRSTPCGARTRIAATAHVGDEARVGDGAHVGDEAHVGDGARVGYGARGVLCDLGREQGRGFARLAYIAHDGSVRVTAGCRNFSLAEAREHWRSLCYEGHPQIAAEYLALIDYVERVAELRKDEIAAMIAQGGGE